jgi:hypothetical protein
VFDSGQQSSRRDIVTPDSVRVEDTAGRNCSAIFPRNDSVNYETPPSWNSKFTQKANPSQSFLEPIRLLDDFESEEEGVTLVCSEIGGNEQNFGVIADSSVQSYNDNFRGNNLLKEKDEILTIKTFGQSSHLQTVAMTARRNQSYHPTIVARLPPGCEATIEISKVGEDHEEFGIGILSNPLSDLLSAKCVNLFSDIFQNIGVYRLSDASDFVETNKNGLGITNKPMTLLFMAVPAVDKKSSKVNVKGQEEFLVNQNFFPNFWNNQLQYRNNTRDSGITCFIDICVKMPEVLFPAQQRISHAEGLVSLKSIGPVVNNDFWYMTLYGSYAQCFVAFMNSELTITGRCNGFRPLFVMTNTNVQQKCHWGVNGTRLTSMDNGAVSFLSLIGFWKQKSNNVDDVRVSGKTEMHFVINQWGSINNYPFAQLGKQHSIYASQGKTATQEAKVFRISGHSYRV